MGAASRLGQAIAARGTLTLKLENLRYDAGQYRLTANPSSAPEGKLALTLTVEPGGRPATSAMGASRGQLGGAKAILDETAGKHKSAIKRPI